MRILALTILALLLCSARVVAGEEMPCPSPNALEKILTCLKSHIGGQAAVISSSDAPATVRIVRVGSGSGKFIYVLVRTGAEWCVIDKLFYEQGHGKRESSFELKRVSEDQLGDIKIVRVEYHTTADTTRGDEEETEQRDVTALCVPAKRKGCLQIATACDMKREADETEVDSYRAKLTMKSSGEVALEFESRGSGKLCKPPTTPLKIW